MYLSSTPLSDILPVHFEPSPLSVNSLLFCATMLHRGSSPSVFDSPEFPPPPPPVVPLRRLKPLPKRRRTSDSDPRAPVAPSPVPATAPSSMPTPLRVPLPVAAPLPDPILGSGGVDSMIAHGPADPAPALSQFALQSYYTSVLRNGTSTRGGLLSGLGAPNEATATVTQSESGADDDPARSATSAGHSAFDHHLSTVYHRGRLAQAQAPGAGADDDLSEGDSTDHVQQWQHGNTKKRKVPANMGARAAGRERSLSLGGSEEEEDTTTTTTMMVGFAGRRWAGHNDNDIDGVLAATPPLLSSLPPAQVAPRKGKISPSALAGLRHKELLRQRKRQLAAMLGALSLGDTFALDQALSTHIPFVSTTRSGPDSDVHKVRLSRRRGPRLARAARAQMTSPDKATTRGASFPAAQFRFAYPSASEWLNLTLDYLFIFITFIFSL